jgi:hypothetical protein
VLGHPTAVRPSTGVWKTVRGQVCLSRIRIQMLHDRPLAGPEAQQAAHQQHVPKSRPPGRRSWLPWPGTPGTNNSKEGKNERQSGSNGAVNADGRQRS